MPAVAKRLALAVALPALFLSLASEAIAARQDNVTIYILGTHDNWGYVSFTEPLTETCNWNNIYFRIDEDSGKAAMSILLTAHASGRTLTRVDYTKDSTGRCILDLAQL